MTDVLLVPKPDGVSRVESGPVQFGADDWPGYFQRGDDALFASLTLEQVADLLAKRAAYDKSDANLFLIAQLKGLAQDMRSCSVGNTGWPPVQPRPVNVETTVKAIIAMLPDDKKHGLAMLEAAKRMVERFKR